MNKNIKAASKKSETRLRNVLEHIIRVDNCRLRIAVANGAQSRNDQPAFMRTLAWRGAQAATFLHRTSDAQEFFNCYYPEIEKRRTDWLAETGIQPELHGDLKTLLAQWAVADTAREMLQDLGIDFPNR